LSSSPWHLPAARLPDLASGARGPSTHVACLQRIAHFTPQIVPIFADRHNPCWLLPEIRLKLPRMLVKQ
jgi:hypothetical protein